MKSNTSTPTPPATLQGRKKNNLKHTTRTPSLIINVLSNLWPLAGVFILHWNWKYVVLIYWIETIVYFLLVYYRMHFSKVGHKKGDDSFYLLFYGMFFGVQTFFLFLFATVLLPEPLFSLTNVKLALIYSIPMAIGHIVSLIQNYYLRREQYKKFNYFLWPMKRLWVGHITVLLGPIFWILINERAYVVILILVKTYFDAKAHMFEHSVEE